MPHPSPAPDASLPVPPAEDQRPPRTEDLGLARRDDGDDGGVGPVEGDGLAAQLEARHRASAEDARAQAPNRLAAAAQAVALLKADMADPGAAPVPTAAPRPGSPPPDERPPPPGSGPMPPAPVGGPSTDAPPRVPVPGGGPARAVSSAFASATASAAAPPARQPISSGTPLYELRPSALGGDVDQLGDQLVVFVDRLEHRDRHGRLRRRMPVRDILDVDVQRRLTGCTFTVRSRAGVDLVLKGVRPDAADEGRRTILTHLTSTRAPAGPPPFDEAGLLRKLVELYRAGVLTEDELAAKTDVVAQLARADMGAATPGPEHHHR